MSHAANLKVYGDFRRLVPRRAQRWPYRIFDRDQGMRGWKCRFMMAMKDKPARGWLTLVCIETGKEIDCGIKYTQDDLEHAKLARLLLQCRYCGKTHIFKFSDARLRPIWY